MKILFMRRVAGSIFFFLLFCNVCNVFSSGEVSLTLSPPYVDLIVKPTELKRFEIVLINNTPKSVVDIECDVLDLTYDERGKMRFLPAGEYSYGAAQYITFSPKKFKLHGGHIQKVNCTVRLPSTARGGRYAAFLARILHPKTEKRLASISLSLASLIFIDIKSKGTRMGPIEISNITMNYSTKTKTYQLSTSIQNRGNIYVQLDCQLNIRKLKGTAWIPYLSRIPLSSDAILFPDCTLAAQTPLSGLDDGLYEADVLVTYGRGLSGGSRARFEVKKENVKKIEEIVSSVQDGELLELLVDPDTEIIKVGRGGVSKLAHLTLHNLYDDDIKVKAHIMDIAPDGYGGSKFIQPDKKNIPYSCARWITLPEGNEFTIPFGRKHNFPVNINIPEGVEGGRYCGLLFTAEALNKKASGSAKATLELQIAPRTIKHSLWVPKFSAKALQTEKKYVYNLELVLNMENVGNIMVEPNVEISLLKEKEEKFSKNLSSVAEVFPGEKVTLVLNIPGIELTPGEYHASVKLDYGAHEPAYGYTTFKIE